MGIKFICKNKSCSYPGATQFEMSFKAESIMDNNNLATAFCPFCKKEMLSSFLINLHCGQPVKASHNEEISINSGKLG
ncbi:hypothetical protein [Desulfobacula toluolica]|uniref:hypothetical protein n=1 Tax=Desulfobacula toluolica TaxID=28223 RepID=UPI0002D485C7|nr:hypothetical protein [Desulfobacula toluolica]